MDAQAWLAERSTRVDRELDAVLPPLDREPAAATRLLERVRTTLVRAGREHHQHKYAAAVRSLTQGKGTHTRELQGYEPVPPHVAEKVIAEAEQEREAALAAR